MNHHSSHPYSPNSTQVPTLRGGGIDLILSRLKGVHSRGKQHMALCPAHGDHNPSLSIRETERGNILIHCFAGCSTQEVMDALGLPMKALFHE